MLTQKDKELNLTTKFFTQEKKISMLGATETTILFFDS